MLEAANVGVLGLWTGIEVVVCYVVRGVLTGSDIRLRQALIRRLRILVPAVFLTAAVLTVATRSVAVGIAIVGWAAVTFGGTVPINSKVLEWSPDAPPAGWRDVITRWERLDIVRCWVVVLALVLGVISPF